jgi:hypothetical protein
MHMFIVTMMFMSLALSLLLSMMRRQGFAEAGGGGGSRGRLLLTPSRQGLSREVTNLLPLNWYKALSRSVMGGGGDINKDVSLLGRGGNDNCRGGIVAPPPRLENNNNDKCCPICLVDFADRSEVCTLPCGHNFNRECINLWLLNHTTCPMCHENINSAPPACGKGGQGRQQLPRRVASSL